jgi:hypothetical protein
LNAAADAKTPFHRRFGRIPLPRRDGCHQHKKGKGFAKVSEVETVRHWQFLSVK